MKYNTMRLTEVPTEIASKTRKSWDVLWEVYGWETFHPLEGRGVLRAMPQTRLRREEAEAMLESLVDRGFATVP